MGAFQQLAAVCVGIERNMWVIDHVYFVWNCSKSLEDKQTGIDSRENIIVGCLSAVQERVADVPEQLERTSTLLLII
jgi:hypothetical protein